MVISGFAVKIIRRATSKVGRNSLANKNQIGKMLLSILSTKKVEWVPSSPSRCWNSCPREAAAFYACDPRHQRHSHHRHALGDGITATKNEANALENLQGQAHRLRILLIGRRSVVAVLVSSTELCK